MRLSASPRHDKSPNDNADEIEEGLEAFPFPVEAESENNNFLTRREVPPQLGKDDAMLMGDKNLKEHVEKTTQQSVANIFFWTEYEYKYIQNVLCNTNTNTNIFGFIF